MSVTGSTTSTSSQAESLEPSSSWEAEEEGGQEVEQDLVEDKIQWD